MHSVVGIIERRRLSFDSFLKDLVKRDIHIGKFLGKLLYYGKNPCKIGTEIILVFVIENVRSYHHDLCISATLQLFENTTIVQRKLLVCGLDGHGVISVPDIVYTDKNRDNVGLEVDSIGIKAVSATCSASALSKTDMIPPVKVPESISSMSHGMRFLKSAKEEE